MLPVEAEILSLDLDAFRLLQGYREIGLSERAARAKAAADEARAAAAEAKQAALDADEPDDEPAAETEQQKGSFDREKSDPWLDRICDLDGVEDERLCEIHGKLIAAGFLNFQMRNRITGLEYRVANPGKQYLTRKLEQASELASETLSDADADPHADAIA